MASAPRRVLISGAGIAGPVVAYWLGLSGIRSTLVERAPSLRTSDIHGVARDVIAKMGLVSVIRNAGTHEAGTHFVDHSNRICASFPVGQGMTNEIETRDDILRSVRRFDGLHLGDSIKSIKESEAEAVVDFESGQTRGFDAIVIADRMHSKSRSLAFQTQETPDSNSDFYYKSLGVHTAYFSIPYREEDGMWSRWGTATGRRSIWLRPVPADPSMLACLIIADPVAQLKLQDSRFLEIPEQKKIWRECFHGAGWKTDQISDHMAGADDFYMQEVAQVRAKGWSKGRVALVGDAAYGPSPMSGMGTTCAVTGAYVLAGELAKQPYLGRDEVAQAYKAYEDYCRPYVERAQDGAIGPMFLRVAWPESGLGVGALRRLIAAVSVVANSRLGKVFARLLPSEPDEGMVLPDYAEMQRHVDKNR
ncbi:LOW QUALITY PROTEIN: hypothetical protein JCM24511_02138 [Saitozyma sp. JCM 24511]|nr:LOW QUALITY PROTEIN: hypothetical protein JCM24511_02138 [Saitozyma sp. JCM 24511]